MQSSLTNSSDDMDHVAECGEHPFPNRQSIRLKGWNYASPGDYFVTINTQGGRPLFGTVVKGKMALNEAGRIAEAEWRKSPEIRPDIALDEYVIKLVLGHLNPGGMLECLLSDAPPDLEIACL